MSILFTESFDLYAIGDLTERWTSDAANDSIVAGAGRCGSAAYRNTSTNDGPAVGVTNTNIAGCMGFAYKPEVFNASNIVEITAANGDVFVFLRVLADGSVDAWRGPNTTLGTRLATSSPGLVSLGVYSFIEFGWTLSNTVGVVTLRVNGAQVAQTTGADTIPSASGAATYTLPWTRLVIQPRGYIDDVYVLNADGSAPGNTFLGDVHIEGQVAVPDSTAAGQYADWTPLSGTDHGAMVDDNPPDDGTTYNSSDTTGNRDTYRFPELASIDSGTVYAVTVLLNAAKSDDIQTRTAAPTLYIGGNTYDGTAQAISTSYRYYWQVYETDPDTSAAWTVAAVNALDAGIKDVSAS